MKQVSAISSMVYYRLIAVWAVAEGLLGSIIHTFQLPVSGLIVGGFAIICIALIANFYPVRGAVLKATLLVCIFKMMLSPQSSIMAYIAVLFQGLTGELLLNRKGRGQTAVYLFTLLALLESALQRILVMTLIYGKKIWAAIDAFISGLTGSETITRYSYFLAGGYILLHLIAGILIAGFILRLIKDLNSHQEKAETNFLTLSSEKEEKKTGRRSWFYFSIYLLIVLLYLQAKLQPEDPWFAPGKTLQLLIRSFLILFTWSLLVSPLLKKVLHHWLERKKKLHESELHAILALVPETEMIIRHSWKFSDTERGLKRIAVFLKKVFVQSFAHAEK